MTTPGYLWSRGLMMYRDIKFPHAPGFIGLLAVGFQLFRPGLFFIRFVSAAPVLAGHLFLLRETREFPAIVRALASAFFLVTFYVSDGNAVWPTVFMTALSLPIAGLLSRRKFAAAGLLIGADILLKQTAAYLLLLAVLVLVLRKRLREAGILFVSGSVPYLAVLGGFALYGAARDMIRWTVEVPLRIGPVVFYAPQFSVAFLVVTAFVPLAVEAVLERPGEYAISARWLLLVAAGLALIGVPRFDLMQTVASVPCLAVGAARLMSRAPRALSVAALVFVATFTLSRASVLVKGLDFDGKVLFWNEEKSFDRLIADLRRLPPTTPLHSRLWANVLPRAELLPPGRIYVNTWLEYLLPVDRIGERVERAAREPGTVVVGPWGTGSVGRRLGPYSIFTVPGTAPTPGPGAPAPPGPSPP